MPTRPSSVIEELAGRFLRPARPRLQELRALARGCDGVPQLLEALGPEPFGPEPAAGARWFRITRRHEARLRGTRTVAGIPVLDRPATLQQAVLYLSDVPALRRAEAAARELARRLWVAERRDGTPPVDVVWRVSGVGSAPGGTDTLRAPVLDQVAALYAFVERPAPTGAGWTGAFLELAQVARFAGAWADGVRAGAVVGDDPLEPLLDVFRTGLGVRAIAASHVDLFVPDRPDAPSRADDVVGNAAWQALLDRELVIACENLVTRAAHAEALLARGANPDQAVAWPSPLWMTVPAIPLIHALADQASATGNPDAAGKLAALIAAGADLGRIDPEGRNALARLCERRGDPRLLLDAGFPIDAPGPGGRTALHQLCARGSADGVARLLPHGPAVDARDELGLTPLHVALLHGHAALLEPLLAAGADPASTTQSGRTAYHFAALGLAGDALTTAVDRLAALGVPNTPDLDGRAPCGTPYPPLRAAPVAPRPASELSPLPEEMVRALATEGDAGWWVLADWLSVRGDVRGELVALALAVEARRAPRRRLAEALDRHRPALLRPFAEAHPLGAALIERADEVELRFERGVLRGLGLPARFAEALPALVDHPGAELLDALSIEVPRASGVAAVLPPHPSLRRLRITVLEGRSRALRVPTERLPALEALHVRCPHDVSVALRAPGPHTVRVEQPYRPNRRWQAHTVDLPTLTRLEVVAGRAPRPEDPGRTWLEELFHHPPPGLRALELRPASTELFAALVAAPLLPRLSDLALTSARAALADDLVACAPRLAHLGRLDLRLVGATRSHRQQLQERIGAVLPAAVVGGIQFRRVGSYD